MLTQSDTPETHPEPASEKFVLGKDLLMHSELLLLEPATSPGGAALALAVAVGGGRLQMTKGCERVRRGRFGGNDKIEREEAEVPIARLLSRLRRCSVPRRW